MEDQAAAPDFWSNQENAQKVLQQRSRVERALNTAEGQQRLVDDIAVLFDFAAEDEASAKELRESVKRLAAEVEESETQMLLGGQNDPNNAFLSINSGAGGTDAQDFAEMLLRMYLRWAQKHGFKVEELDWQAGEEAGVKSASYRIEGDYVYGLLAGEVGVHRL
ncbi:MAG TPA: PCRF domain-containing protein, partial [Blastocatellia bacterium]|nr:PCRF domain-containing protein [Blastocatellia bacterium]